MEYVTDTHAMLWHLFMRRRLGSAARVAFADADAGSNHIYLPAVSLAEMINVVQKGRLPGATVPQLLAHVQLLQSSANYSLLSLTPDTVIASHALTPIPDIFDRLVIAETARLTVPLISRDTTIAATGLVPVVWE